MERINKFVKRAFRVFGLDISRISRPISILLYYKIDLLLDVGANIGQYALSSREQGYKNRIVSFEPLSEAHKALMESSINDHYWEIHERCAVGEKIGEAEINISKNSHSSSLLPMLSAHSDAAPDSVYVGKNTTKIVTLDSIFNNYREVNDRVFLKIDTQGYEKQVLDGASECLKDIIGVQLELSIIPLYDSQYIYEYFFQFFRDNGFALWSLVPGFYDLKTGQLLQFDAIFIRENQKTAQHS